MKLVIIEHPAFTRSDGLRCTPEEVKANMDYLKFCIRDCLRRGEAPYSSVAVFALTGALDDDNPKDRELGIEAGLLWGEKAEATVVYEDRGITTGMRLGIKHAIALGRRIIWRRLNDA